MNKAGMDTVPEATVHVRFPIRQARLLATGQAERILDVRPDTCGGGFTPRTIEPWGLRIIRMGELECRAG